MDKPLCRHVSAMIEMIESNGVCAQNWPAIFRKVGKARKVKAAMHTCAHAEPYCHIA